MAGLVRVLYTWLIMGVSTNGDGCDEQWMGTERMEIVTTSIITCPECGHQSEETMPTEACQFFYSCPHCQTTLRPLEGDCCVFCSYGSVPCPPIQLAGDCCGPSAESSNTDILER